MRDLLSHPEHEIRAFLNGLRGRQQVTTYLAHVLAEKVIALQAVDLETGVNKELIERAAQEAMDHLSYVLGKYGDTNLRDVWYECIPALRKHHLRSEVPQDPDTYHRTRLAN